MRRCDCQSSSSNSTPDFLITITKPQIEKNGYNNGTTHIRPFEQGRRSGKADTETRWPPWAISEPSRSISNNSATTFHPAIFGTKNSLRIRSHDWRSKGLYFSCSSKLFVNEQSTIRPGLLRWADAGFTEGVSAIAIQCCHVFLIDARNINGKSTEGEDYVVTRSLESNKHGKPETDSESGSEEEETPTKGEGEKEQPIKDEGTEGRQRYDMNIHSYWTRWFSTGCQERSW